MTGLRAEDGGGGSKVWILCSASVRSGCKKSATCLLLTARCVRLICAAGVSLRHVCCQPLLMCYLLLHHVTDGFGLKIAPYEVLTEKCFWLAGWLSHMHVMLLCYLQNFLAVNIKLLWFGWISLGCCVLLLTRPACFCITCSTQKIHAVFFLWIRRSLLWKRTCSFSIRHLCLFPSDWRTAVGWYKQT